MERKDKSDTSQNRRDWNHLRIIQKIPEQHTGKARYQGIAGKKGHIWSLQPASESTCYNSTKRLSWEKKHYMSHKL